MLGALLKVLFKTRRRNKVRNRGMKLDDQLSHLDFVCEPVQNAQFYLYLPVAGAELKYAGG